MMIHADQISEQKNEINFELISLMIAFLGSIWKNRAPPPKNGSIYLPLYCGMCLIKYGISFDFPPLYFTSGFILWQFLVYTQ